MSFNAEVTPKTESQEEEKTPRVVMVIGRHSFKAKEQEGESPDNVSLTPKGRNYATGAGLKLAESAGITPQPHALYMGSPKPRSRETALRWGVAGRMEVNENTTHEQILDFVNQEVTDVGKRVVTTKLLDFIVDKKEPLGKAYYDAFTKKENPYALRVLYEQSEQLEQDKTMTFSDYVVNIGHLMQKMLAVYPAWHRMVTKSGESTTGMQKYSKMGHEFQWFAGSHGTVTEPILMAIIQLKEGQEAAEKFLASHENGFAESETYTVTAEGLSQAPSLTIRYQDKSWTITPEELETIITEHEAKPRAKK